MRWPVLLGWSVLFAVAHTQAPLYYSNQNQYLLHGAALGGHGHLAADWLASTADPTPVFSAGVAFAYRFLDPSALHAAYFVLLMGYCAAAVRLMEAVPGIRVGPAAVGLFVVIHAGVWRWASVRLTGYDWPWLLQAGLAGQYALGPSLQPSAFAALLIGAVAAAAHRRPFLAVVLAAAAATIHSTYLVTAAVFTLAVMIDTARDRGLKTAVGVGAVALLVVAPVVAYNLLTFSPTDPDTFATARELIAYKRIPHHALPHRWLDGPAAVTIGWMLLGLAAAWRTRAFLPLALLAAVIPPAAWYVHATADLNVALLFPWRASVVIVPAGAALVAARLGAVCGRVPNAVVLALTAVAVVAGGVITLGGYGYRMNPNELGVIAFARDTARPGDVYLIPAKYPNLLTGRGGNPSASFVEPKPEKNIIPVDLQRFRLASGVPVYVDFKSIPYRDTDLIEWDRRLKAVERWYAERDWDKTGVLAEVREAGVTHVVAAADRDVTASGLELVYSDEAYRVYRLKTERG